MSVKWTEEQRQVIDLQDRNILVSAAAGSGKTAVLVERILQKIIRPQKPLDIDQLLIVTFTRAAAGEMRERLLKTLESRLAAEPENERLQRQSALIHHAQITTIDGFCAHVLRNYFHTIGLDPAYRTADEGELKLLKAETVQEVLEEAYASKSPEFEHFVECYAQGREDGNLEEMILRLYEFSMSYPWPQEWLEDCRKTYQAESWEQIEASPWMACLAQEADRLLGEALEITRESLTIAGEPEGPWMYQEALQQDAALLGEISGCSSYGERVRLLSQVKYARLSAKKDPNVSQRKKEQVKGNRDRVKEILKGLTEQFYYGDQESVLANIKNCASPVGTLVELTKEFSRAFAQKKRQKNLLDFADMEHFALEILVEKKDGQVVRKPAALEFSAQFEEILIDEYQDSNLVQELLLTSVSRAAEGHHNIFMVGDVKQSIYRFRLARPELFMEKYDTYSTEGGEEQRIDLHRNFRSRREVLESVNFLFEQFMTRGLGGVEYDADAALYPGAKFAPLEGEESPEKERTAQGEPAGEHSGEESSASTLHAAEVLLVEKDGELVNEDENATAMELEARAVGSRIRQLVGHQPVWDKELEAYRPAMYRDCVILLRSISGWAETFGRVLQGMGIPSYSSQRTGYFSAQEVVTVLNYLRICDNPLQDIPLAAVLRSPFGDCSARELALIRNYTPEGPLYGALRRYAKPGEEETEERPIGRERALQEKLGAFLLQYDRLRARVPHTPIHQLIQEILDETGYGKIAAAMPAGEQRRANLEMLLERAVEFESTSYRGLFNFVRYIEHLQKYQVDFGQVNVAGEQEDTVRIMTIHKSKGLEFPIVFVSGLGKRFNLTDANSSLVLHPDLGIGAESIHPELRVKAPTLVRQVIRRQTVLESLGEELRVYYVAFTRAKEKLILTGTIDRLKRRVQALEALGRRTDRQLSYGTLEKARMAWDWILPALARHRSFDELLERYELPRGQDNPLRQAPGEFVIRVIQAEDLVWDQVENQLARRERREQILQLDPEKVYDAEKRRQLTERFSYVYPHQGDGEIPVKLTVSQLKGARLSEEDSQELYPKPRREEPFVPSFLREDTPLKGADRGTAYHRVLECLDFTRASSQEEIKEQLAALRSQEKLEEAVYKTVRPRELLRLTDSPLGRRMASAQSRGDLVREQPFVLDIPASEQNPQWSSQETILIQGVMDAYFYEDGELVLVDYKTDFVQRGQEQQLADTYRKQLLYYAQALERLTGMRVKERILYSFGAGKALRV